MSPALPVLVGLAGPDLGPAEAALLERHRPAGVILLARNDGDTASLAGLCRRVRRILGEKALVAADQEGGAVTPLGRALGRPPSPAALGAVDDPDLTRRVHALTARRAREAGVDLVLAPVCDLDRPANPVIGLRAFARAGSEEAAGERARRAALHAAAAARGLAEGGVLACAKHWPGHGPATADSHLDTITLGLSRSGWEAADRLPFAAALRAGCPLLMPGHLALPSVDPTGRIAPLSPPLLRAARDLGARLLVSDALEMAGFGNAPPVAAVEAGCDLLILARPVQEVAPLLEDLDRDLQPASRGRALERLDALERPAPGTRGDGTAWEETLERALEGAAGPRARHWALLDLAAGDRLLRLPGEAGPVVAEAPARAVLEEALGPPVKALRAGPCPLGPAEREAVEAFGASLPPGTALVVLCLRSPGPTPLRPTRALWGAVLGHPEARALLAPDVPCLHLAGLGAAEARILATGLSRAIDTGQGRC